MSLYEALLAREGWTKAFEDETAALFVRADLANR
jgi:hypothetical protein